MGLRFSFEMGSSCGPIALCEVQAYAFAAKIAGASIASALGKREKARDAY